MVQISNIRISTLNVRGLISKKKRDKVFMWLKNNNNGIICIQETHCTKSNLEYFKNSWKGLSFYGLTKSSHSKGVGILFNNELDVCIGNIVECGEGRTLLINCTINQKPVTIVSCYAPNDEKERIDWLMDTKTWILKHADHMEELIVCGDFNCCLGTDDRSSGTHLNDKSRKTFNIFIEQLKLFDSISINKKNANRYTWTDGHIRSRLDYVLMRKETSLTIKDMSHVTVISDKKSQRVTDHKAVHVNCLLKTDKRGPGYWKLNVLLLENEEYKSKVIELINEIQRCDISNAKQRWELLKIKIKELSIKFSAELAKKTKGEVTRIESKLAEFDKLDVLTEDQTLEKHSLQNVLHAHYEHSTYGAQIRARIEFINKGETNYKFMKAIENSNQTKNTILQLKNDQNEIVRTNKEILSEIGKFYSNLYTSKNIELNKIENYLSDVTELPTLSEQQKVQLEKPLSKDEFSKIIKILKPNKSPGYDGIPNEFYQTFWDDIQTMFMSMINESWEEGSLPSTMNTSILSLIHKGESRDDISNYRPISLTNTDYKLVAFVFSNRLQNVIASIVNPDQTGYIKNRYIGCNIRNIIDIYDHCEINDIEGALMSIDFKKAFDSLEHNFMFEVLKIFNFGSDYISWIKMLYKAPLFKVKNNGWISCSHRMERGIRQGCPMSALLFILCTEIMGNKIRNSDILEGINLGNYNHRICQYADDAIVFVKRAEMVPVCLSIIYEFCVVAGLELNLKKCKGIWLGPLKNLGIRKAYGIIWTGNPIRCLGIYVGHNANKTYYLNWTKRLEKIEQFLILWSRLNLSLFGKVSFIKTYALSKIIFPATMLNVPPDVIKKLNCMFYKFIWGKRDKITRSVSCNSVSKGGLNMIDLNNFFITLKASWIKRLYTIEGKWKSGFEQIAAKLNVPAYYLLKINITDLSRCTNNVTMHLNTFYTDILYSFYKCKTFKNIDNMSYHDVIAQPIWFNRIFTYKDKCLFYKEWIEANILYVKDIVNSQGQIMTDAELKDKIGCNCNLVHQLFMFRNSTMKKLRSLDFSVAPYVRLRTFDKVLIKNKLYEVQNLNTKLLYDALIEKKSSSHNKMETVYNREFKIENKKPTWNRIYEQKLSDVKAVKLKEFNFKLLHNIVPCGYILSKWIPNVDKNCKRCGEVETTKHMLFDCTYIQGIWSRLSSIISITLKWKHVVTGFYNFESKSVRVYNYLISIVVYAIFKEIMHCKYSEKDITNTDLKWKIRYNIEFYALICNINKCKIIARAINEL